MRYTEFSNFIKLPKSDFDERHRGTRFLEPKPMTVASLCQFDRPFGPFVRENTAAEFSSKINLGQHGRANLVGSVSVFSRPVVKATWEPTTDGKQYFVQAQLNTWGCHARLWLEKGCVYDMDQHAPRSDLTILMYESFLNDRIVPDYIFRAASSLPETSDYVRLKNKLMQFKLAATENSGMYEMR